MEKVERFWHSLWRRRDKEEAKQLEAREGKEEEGKRGVLEVTRVNLPEENRATQLGKATHCKKRFRGIPVSSRE